jgi:hypothetical protein
MWWFTWSLSERGFYWLVVSGQLLVSTPQVTDNLHENWSWLIYITEITAYVNIAEDAKNYFLILADGFQIHCTCNL